MSKKKPTGGKGKEGSGGQASGDAAETPQEFKINKDPRFLENAREMGNPKLGERRIVGGKPVRRGEFPDCVALGSDFEWACTGTLIGPNVVLTAGHCARWATRVFFGNNVEAAGLVVAVARSVPHPEFSQDFQNDLMVVILSERVTTVVPRRLATKAQIDAARGGRAVGFGYEDPQATTGLGLKRMVDLPIASPGCRGKVNGRDDRLAYGCHRGLEIVAGRPLLGQDSCKGDSGGPFYISDGAGGWLLAGATSRATVSSINPCGDGGIYVRVDRYRSWIAGIPGVELA